MRSRSAVADQSSAGSVERRIRQLIEVSSVLKIHARLLFSVIARPQAAAILVSFEKPGGEVAFAGVREERDDRLAFAFRAFRDGERGLEGCT